MVLLDLCGYERREIVDERGNLERRGGGGGREEREEKEKGGRC